MWLFSFMHSCNIFLQTNSVQKLWARFIKAPLLLTREAGGLFSSKIEGGLRPGEPRWPCSPSPSPLRLPQPRRDQESVGRGRGGGEAAQDHAPNPRGAAWQEEKGEDSSGWCRGLGTRRLDHKRDLVPTRTKRARSLPLSSRETLRRPQCELLYFGCFFFFREDCFPLS